ncbi:MAG TPA: alpha/beta fold hydrolase [Burkholderiales bacterium]|jgi:pimeloyl-ACP methyl ester carboxylesterase|nr:alpha/beta fold hydrolase [Burkholderiales bacterium]
MTIPAHVRRGSGDIAVVLLHGVGGSAAAWAPQLDAIADAGCLAVAWDAPGYGASAPIEPYDMPNLARALERLLDALPVRRRVLVGHSMGGMVAQEAATAFPQKIDGLVLSATSPAFGKADGAWQQGFLAQRLGPLDAGRTMAELAPALVAAMVGPDAEPPGVTAATEIMARVPGETYRKALHALVRFDRRDALAAIRVPTLVIAGERDANAPPAVMEKMAARIAGAEYRVLAGCGHLANLERPRSFNQLVLAWLGRHFAA